MNSICFSKGVDNLIKEESYANDCDVYIMLDKI